MIDIHTPSPDTLRAIAHEALRRTAARQGLAPDSITSDAVAGLTELMIVAARIEAKAAARALEAGRQDVDSAA